MVRSIIWMCATKRSTFTFWISTVAFPTLPNIHFTYHISNLTKFEMTNWLNSFNMWKKPRLPLPLMAPWTSSRDMDHWPLVLMLLIDAWGLNLTVVVFLVSNMFYYEALVSMYTIVLFILWASFLHETTVIYTKLSQVLPQDIIARMYTSKTVWKEKPWVKINAVVVSYQFIFHLKDWWANLFWFTVCF